MTRFKVGDRVRCNFDFYNRGKRISRTTVQIEEVFPTYCNVWIEELQYAFNLPYSHLENFTVEEYNTIDIPYSC